MSFHYSVSLPVKAYIKKYIHTIEGSPIRFDSNSMLCMIIRAYLQSKAKSGRSRQELISAVSIRRERLEIQIPKTKKNISVIGLHIKEDNIVLINRYLEELFEQELHRFINQYIQSAEGRYKGYKEAYFSFAELYNIVLEEDITFDGLKKLEYRNRKKYSEKKGFPLVPSLQRPLFAGC